MTIRIFTDHYGKPFTREDPDGKLSDFYRAVTGRYPEVVQPLDNLADERQERVIWYIRVLAGTQKIEAIKLVRAITDWGLKESKDWVEALP